MGNHAEYNALWGVSMVSHVIPEMFRDRILHEEIYDKHAEYLCELWYDGTRFFEDFDSYADPFTLNIDELKECWERYRRDRGYV